VPAEPTAVTSAQNAALGITTLVSWLLTASLGAYMLSTLIASGALREQRAIRGALSPRVLLGHFSLAGTGLAVWTCYVATGRVALAWCAVGLLMPAIGLGISTVTLWTPYPRPGNADRDDRATSAGLGADPGRASPGADPGRASPADHGLTDGGLTSGGLTDGGLTDGGLTRQVTDEMLVRALTDDVLASQLVEQVIAGAAAAPRPAARRPKVHLAALIPAGHGVAAVTTFALAVVTAAGAGR
jgi:hypothetical protein